MRSIVSRVILETRPAFQARSVERLVRPSSFICSVSVRAHARAIPAKARIAGPARSWGAAS